MQGIEGENILVLSYGTQLMGLLQLAYPDNFCWGSGSTHRRCWTVACAYEHCNFVEAVQICEPYEVGPPDGPRDIRANQALVW